MVSKLKKKELAEAIHSTPGFRQTAYMSDCIAERIIELGWVPIEDFPDEELPAPTQPVVNDIMERIISGLPTNRLYDVGSLHPQEVVITDIVSKYPKITDKPGEFANISPRKDVPGAPHWSVIPNFENYEICRDGEVRNKWTKRLMEVEYENCASYIEMHDKDGFSHKVSTMTLAAITEKLFA